MPVPRQDRGVVRHVTTLTSNSTPSAFGGWSDRSDPRCLLVPADSGRTRPIRGALGHRGEAGNLYGEFDPGSGRTLAARLTHASRTVNRASARESVANGCVTRGQPAPDTGITPGNRG